MITFPHPIEAVILDMDGLLLDTERVYRTAFVTAAAGLGYALPEAFYLKLVGAAEDDCYAQIAAHFGPAFPTVGYARACHRALAELLHAGIPLKPGAAELLEALRRLGLPAAIATSTGRALAEDHLQRAGLRHRVDALVTRDEVARGKPSPDLFLHAARTLGADPGRCVVLEDSHHGIRAANAAGAMPVMVPDLLEPTDELRGLCIAVVRDLHEARALLAKR